MILKSASEERLWAYFITMIGASWLAEHLYELLNGVELRQHDFVVVATLFFLMGVSEIVLCQTLKVSLSHGGIAYRAYLKSFEIDHSEVTQINWSDRIGWRSFRGIEFGCGDEVHAMPLYGLSDSDKLKTIEFIRTSYAETKQEGWEKLVEYYEQLKSRSQHEEIQTPALLPAIYSTELAILLLYIPFAIDRRNSLTNFLSALPFAICSLIFFRDMLIYAGMSLFGKPIFPRYISQEHRGRATTILWVTMLACLGLGISGLLDRWASTLIVITCTTFLLWVRESSKSESIEERS